MKATGWTYGAVLLAAVWALVVVLLPAVGLTFTGDDWMNWELLRSTPVPQRWILPLLEHWEPLYIIWFELQRAVFGFHHTAWISLSFLVHVLNLYLLARYLHAATGDERAAAVTTLIFGIAVTYRELLLVASQGGLTVCFTMAVLSLLAFEHYREEGGRWLAVSVAAAFLAPFVWAAALPMALILALFSLVLQGGPWRGRVKIALLYASAFCVYAILYVAMSRTAVAATEHSLPATGDQLRKTGLFLCEQVGLGVVRTTLLLPTPEDALTGFLLTLAAAAAVAITVYVVPRKCGTRIVLSAVALLAFFGPIALARWRLLYLKPPAASWSHYLYVPALAWTAGVASALVPALRLRPRATLGACLVFLAWLAWGHAGAASRDDRWFAAAARRDDRHLLEALVAAATGASGPVYDAPLPRSLAWPGTRARNVLHVIDPKTGAIAWTGTRSTASLAPYEGDPALRALVGLPPGP